MSTPEQTNIVSDVEARLKTLERIVLATTTAHAPSTLAKLHDELWQFAQHAKDIGIGAAAVAIATFVFKHL